jgi:hypothetical protein
MNGAQVIPVTPCDTRPTRLHTQVQPSILVLQHGTFSTPTPSTSFPHVKQNSMAADTTSKAALGIFQSSYSIIPFVAPLTYIIYIWIMEPLWSGSAVTTCDLIISAAAALVQLQQSIQFWFVQQAFAKRFTRLWNEMNLSARRSDGVELIVRELIRKHRFSLSLDLRMN